MLPNPHITSHRSPITLARLRKTSLYTDLLPCLLTHQAACALAKLAVHHDNARVAIARALINEPVLLLADEPSGNLDSKNASNIHSLFAEINRELRTTLVIVTHNQEFAQSLPRRLEMRDGEIVSDKRKE